MPRELLAMENVVLLPHLGSASVCSRARKMDQLVVDNILAWAAGKPPLTPVPETPWRSWRKHDPEKWKPVFRKDRAALTEVRAHSAAMRTSGAAARTSASTWSSNWTKFFWNMSTSLRAVWSNSSLFCQVFCG